MVMGQEERKNKAKLEKTQISVATTNTEYENAVKALEDTTARWNREWKAAADKFQDLEEERLDFTKSSLWTFANISSTVCVSDDSSCEKIRLSLEKMDVENDIINFITEKGTGQEIPDSPRYINFCRGDVEDHQPEPPEEENYSVAQFPRSINPAFRTSSPQPSTFESHHDPNSALARDLGHHEPPAPHPAALPAAPPAPLAAPLVAPLVAPANRELTFPPQKAAAPVIPPQDGHQGHGIQQYEPRHDPVLPPSRDMAHHNHARLSSRDTNQPQQRAAIPAAPAQDRRHENRVQQYDTSQFAEVPHDPYPMDGMTMLCRTDGMNSATSSNLSARPSSRDDNSEYSNPTSLSSQEPPSGKVSPAKQEPVVEPQPDKRVLKKKSGFFQNHSPFRRKSIREIQPSNRNTWGPVSSSQNVPQSTPQSAPQSVPQPVHQPVPQSVPQNSSQSVPGSRRPHHGYQSSEPRNMLSDRTASPEPIDANASLALNVGQNVFPVATPDSRKNTNDSGTPKEELDPIALALAELKGVAGNKQSAGRISADHYHGIITPAPDRAADRAIDRPQPHAFSRSVPAPKTSSDVAAAIRGTPPPSYDQQIQRLGVPPPAVTSKAMQESSRKYTEQTREMFKPSRPGTGTYASTPARPTTRGTDMPRAASPAAPRAASPQPRMHIDTRQQPRSTSPNPYSSAQAQSQRAPSPNPYASSQAQAQNVATPNSYPNNQLQLRKALPQSSYTSSQRPTQRAPSPNPYSPGQNQSPAQEVPSPTSYSASRNPLQKPAPPSSYSTSQNHTQKTASPSTYGGSQRQAQEATSPSPFSASQSQTQKSASPRTYTTSQRQTRAPASPSSYSTGQSNMQKAAPESPNPYSSGQSNMQKAAVSPSSYTTSQRQAQGASSPNPYSAGQNSMPKAAPTSPNPYSGSQRQAPRSASPNPYAGSPRQTHRSVSPNPYAGSQHRDSVSSQRGPTPTRGPDPGYFGRNSPGDAARASSPSVYRGDYGRPDSRDSRAGADMAIQLAPGGGGGGGGGDPYGSMRSNRSGRPGTSASSRTAAGVGAMTFYDGRDPMQEASRQRSQSVADPSRQYTRDGRAILHYGTSCIDQNKIQIKIERERERERANMFFFRGDSTCTIHVPSGDPRGAGVQQGGCPGGPAPPGRRLVGGGDPFRQRRRDERAGSQQLPASLLIMVPG